MLKASTLSFLSIFTNVNGFSQKLTQPSKVPWIFKVGDQSFEEAHCRIGWDEESDHGNLKQNLKHGWLWVSPRLPLLLSVSA